MFTDKIIKCRDCGTEFVFTAGEQEFYSEKGFDSNPQRCKKCRTQRKHSERRHREVIFYEIVCARCGKVESIPFEPRHDRPVYCVTCHKAINQLK